MPHDNLGKVLFDTWVTGRFFDICLNKSIVLWFFCQSKVQLFSKGFLPVAFWPDRNVTAKQLAHISWNLCPTGIAPRLVALEQWWKKEDSGEMKLSVRSCYLVKFTSVMISSSREKSIDHTRDFCFPPIFFGEQSKEEKEIILRK